jgi:DNA (cytosine-5)-methyltransferase 1
VFVVASARNDICPAEILFEFESVRRDTSPSRKEGQEIANCLTKSPSSHSSYNPARSEGNAVVVEKVGTLLARDYKGLGSFDHDKMVVSSIGYCNNLAPTLTSSGAGISRVGNDTTADAQYIVQQAFRKSRRAQSVNDFETWVDDGKANTLNTFDLGDVRTTHAIAIPIHPQALLHEGGGKARNNDGKGNGLGVGENGEPMNTLTTVDRHMVAIGVDVYNHAIDGQVAATMTEACGGTNTSGPKVMQNMAVRRLTPIECERLQGFPDNYTNIKANCPDGPRYKALGNSWAVPVVAWIGKRINDAIA